VELLICGFVEFVELWICGVVDLLSCGVVKL